MSHGVKDFEELVDHLLTFLSLAVESKKVKTQKVFGIPDLRYWDGAEPILGEEAWEGVERTLQAVDPGRDDRLLVHPKDISCMDQWPVDMRILTAITDDDDEERRLAIADAGFMLHRTRSLTAQEIRGKFYARYAVEVSHAIVDPGGTYYGVKSYYGSMSGKAPWKRYILNMFEPPPDEDSTMGAAATFEMRQMRHGLRDEDEEGDRIHLALSLQFSRFYEWGVTLGYSGKPALRFATNPLGAMEVFRLRDLPEGAGRRAALRNWVCQHWRKRRAETDEAAEIKVRQHLRGAETFHWNGLRCTIHPSQDAIKENERLRREREAERRGKI